MFVRPFLTGGAGGAASGSAGPVVTLVAGSVLEADATGAAVDPEVGAAGFALDCAERRLFRGFEGEVVEVGEVGGWAWGGCEAAN